MESDFRFSACSEAIRSHSTSTSSLFSLKNTRSYPSILDFYTTTESGDVENGDVAALEYEEEPALYLETDRDAALTDNDKFIVILVGLPATGKSTISRHLVSYLRSLPSLMSLRCGVFNAGQVRRKLTYKGERMPIANSSKEDLFNPRNSEKKNVYARITLEELLSELDADMCDFAIFDATNSTLERRSFIFQEIQSYNDRPQNKYRIIPVVLQVTCSNKAFIRFNIHNKAFNQDYLDKPYEFAVRDFARRLRYYYSQFVPFTKEEFNHIIQTNSHTKNDKSCCVRNDRLYTREDTGLFFFHIINAGLDTDLSSSMTHYPREVSLVLSEVVSAIEEFVNRYSQIYGFQYIENANSFMKGEPVKCTKGDGAKANFTGAALANNNVLAKKTTTLSIPNPASLTSYLPTLCSIINDQYFQSLTSFE
ncbi:HBL305Cp [Eremothecium sinecaudum]|uniref:HBL305Cp n=1 Tax=Eremothecium sinecaudum TaxID=45286 RepID=A0A109UWG2_9SACH|nr:HBL305Cp [Eremothecium sinecaudum]AMD18597.1 HBL305Cp [Eremothecium sinecaudum]